MIDSMNIDIYEKKGRYGYEKEMDLSFFGSRKSFLKRRQKRLLQKAVIIRSLQL